MTVLGWVFLTLPALVAVSALVLPALEHLNPAAVTSSKESPRDDHHRR